MGDVFEPWELILHHTYSGTPGAIFDHSPGRGAHGVGVGLDPTALDQKREVDRFRQKVDAGAEFAITQPVFDPDALFAALLRALDQAQA